MILTLFYASGAKQIINVHPSFMKPLKGEPTPHEKCVDIMLDKGADKYTLTTK